MSALALGKRNSLGVRQYISSLESSLWDKSCLFFSLVYSNIWPWVPTRVRSQPWQFFSQITCLLFPIKALCTGCCVHGFPCTFCYHFLRSQAGSFDFIRLSFEHIRDILLFSLTHMVALFFTITSVRRVSKLVALTCRENFLVLHKVVLRPRASILSEVVSSFLLNQDIILVFLRPAPIHP